MKINLVSELLLFRLESQILQMVGIAARIQQNKYFSGQ
jgi:hypothetical protein